MNRGDRNGRFGFAHFVTENAVNWTDRILLFDGGIIICRFDVQKGMVSTNMWRLKIGSIFQLSNENPMLKVL